MCPQVKHKSTQRQVNITVKKQGHVWWDRLTKQEKKPLFLAPDFDRWLDESDAEMELREKVKRFTNNQKHKLCVILEELHRSALSDVLNCFLYTGRENKQNQH